MLHLRVPTLLTAAFLASCAGSPYSVVSPFPKSGAGSTPAQAAAQQPSGWERGTGAAAPLYGWDGAPVAGPIHSASPGSVEVSGQPLPHGLEGSEGGGSRLVLLEQYQKTVQERERLALEVEAQKAELEKARQKAKELEQRYFDLEQKFDILSAEKSAVEQQNRDLAARLTTAQIRRLQAEKAWLESAIQWQAEAVPTALVREGADDGSQAELGEEQL